MKGGGRGAAPLGGYIHEYQIGGGAIPIGEMRKVQDRLAAAASPIHRKHRQGDEDAGAGVHFQGHGAEPSPAGCPAHRRQGAGRRGRWQQASVGHRQRGSRTVFASFMFFSFVGFLNNTLSPRNLFARPPENQR